MLKSAQHMADIENLGTLFTIRAALYLCMAVIEPLSVSIYIGIGIEREIYRSVENCSNKIDGTVCAFLWRKNLTKLEGVNWLLGISPEPKTQNLLLVVWAHYEMQLNDILRYYRFSDQGYYLAMGSSAVSLISDYMSIDVT